MPKAARKQTKGAVLARERRAREKKDAQYNIALKEFLDMKYRHIIAEFDPLYKNIMGRRPVNMIYTNTVEFRIWRRREMHKEIQSVEQQQVEQQQVEQPVEQQQVEQPIEQEQVEQPIEQQVLAGLLQDEQLAELLRQVELPVEEVEQPVEQEQVEQPIEQPVNNNNDEGIVLDAWEELQGDIHDFNYRLEVELEQYLT